jgi:putative flippase GtrA
MKKLDLLYKIRQEFISMTFLKYLIIGLISISINYSSRFVFRIVFQYVVSVAISTGLANFINYLLNRVFTFKMKNSKQRKQLLKFLAASVGGIVVTSVAAYLVLQFLSVLHFLAEDRNRLEMISHLVAIGFSSTIYGYLITKYFVFAKEEE